MILPTFKKLLDLTACDIESISSHRNIYNFIKALVTEIDMVAYGEPFIERFATHDPAKAGYSLCQMITTSSITGHFVELNGNAYLDIFSCKPYDIETVCAVVTLYFKPKKIRHHFISRDA